MDLHRVVPGHLRHGTRLDRVLADLDRGRRRRGAAAVLRRVLPLGRPLPRLRRRRDLGLHRLVATAGARPASGRQLSPAAAAPTLGRVKTFDALFAELADKATTRPAGSRTVAEIDSGVHGIGKKVVEEAAEVWMAAEFESDERTAEEISQLLYHLQVLMIARGLTLDDVYAHL